MTISYISPVSYLISAAAWAVLITAFVFGIAAIIRHGRGRR
jgi:hypothetical protein